VSCACSGGVGHRLQRPGADVGVVVGMTTSFAVSDLEWVVMSRGRRGPRSAAGGSPAGSPTRARKPHCGLDNMLGRVIALGFGSCRWKSLEVVDMYGDFTCSKGTLKSLQIGSLG
jgi:hypothetical protein